MFTPPPVAPQSIAQPTQPQPTDLTVDNIKQRLSQVIDPELNVDMVSLGLIYDVVIRTKQTPEGPVPFVHIVMTLTTPGCPLAGVFDPMIRQALEGLDELDTEQNVYLELTFDPPWLPDMMSAEAKAELGFD